MAYVPAPSYNMQPIDVWGSFQQGAQVAGALRARREEREQTQAYGEAFGQGGWGGVAETAGGMGDLETANTAQDNQSQQQESQYERAQRNVEVLANVATSLMGVPYEQRRERLAQLSPELERMGLDPQQIAAYDPTDEALTNVRALQGQYSQYTDIREHEGALVGQRADGTFEVLREAQPQWQDVPPDQLPAGARFGQRNQRTGQAEFDYNAAGSGGAPPSGYRATPDGQSLEPIPGGPRDPNAQVARAYPPEQRARVAITYDAALEASQFLEEADRQAVARQGTHSSDTPFGQDWLARAAEAVPFDGGTVARTIGGEDYQQYTRASSAFESAMLPILSGAAVTESEAQRVVRAALPRQGDNQETLAAKTRMRQQMLNGAAMIGGRQMPFPDIGAPPWAQGGAQTPQSAPRSLEELSDEEFEELYRQAEEQGLR